jgi:hypothetical protein
VTNLSETVRQESAALYRFIDSVIRRCAEIHEYPVYTPSSEEFLKYVKTLGAETKEFLKEFPSSAEKDKDTARSKRRKLNSVRSGWENLHEYLQAALAADTLHVPTSLIFAIQDRINKLEDLKDLRFTVFHSDQVNYLQLPPGTVKEAADELADIVKGTRFPLSLGLIGMPYSQSDGFLLNCLLAHEMGHVAYQEVYSPDVATEIERVLEALEKEVGVLDDQDITLSLDTLKYWTEEIFCDLFAICLIGPAYSFALIEQESKPGHLVLIEGAKPGAHEGRTVVTCEMVSSATAKVSKVKDCRFENGATLTDAMNVVLEVESRR